MTMTRGLSLAAAAALIGLMSNVGSAFAQAGGPNVTAPVVNESTRATTDAAKKNAEMERRRLDEEAKKSKAATGK
jgi:hypothetical protein